MSHIEFTAIYVEPIPVSRDRKSQVLKDYVNYLKNTLDNEHKLLSLSSYNKTLAKIERLKAKLTNKSIEIMEANTDEKFVIVDDATFDNEQCFELTTQSKGRKKNIEIINKTAPVKEYTEEYINDMFSTIH